MEDVTEGETSSSHVSAQIPWSEGQPQDFIGLQEAIASGQAKRDEFEAEDDSSSSEDDEEPGENQPGNRLLWASQHNRLDLMQVLLESQPDLVKFADEDGYTALHRAAYSDNREVCVALLMAGSDLAARTNDGWTPLHSASRWNSASCVELLLAWGADVNSTTQGGQTPLHLAAFCAKSRNSLLLLLNHPRIQPMTKNCQEDTPADIARRNGNSVDLFDLLLPPFRTVFSDGNT